MSHNIMTASNEWAQRPLDERFWGLQDMGRFLQEQKNNSQERTIDLRQLRAVSENGDLLITAGTAPAHFTNWSFNQICTRAHPATSAASLLRTLKPATAALVLNEGFNKLESEKAKVLLHRNGITKVRAFTGPDYGRIWNSNLLERIKPALDMGWMVPPARPTSSDPRSRPATESDILPNQSNFALSVKVGDMIAPAGCYAGDRDMFIFLVNPNRSLDSGLMRGMIVRNSEVGLAAFSLSTFLLEHVCGNHICWGATGLQELRIVHRGRANARFESEMTMELRKYDDQGMLVEERMISSAKNFILGINREETVNKVYSMKQLTLTRKDIEGAYDAAEKWEHTAGATPNTAWGFVHGLTRHSQVASNGYADERYKIDQAGGKLLQIAYKASN